ncbi:MAG: IPTL-CTERM sorting domain-containing protein [Casimicrobiaceae bacterium]
MFGAFVSAYSGAFDPTNLATNYLGDPGLSVGDPSQPGSTPLQVNLAAGQTITLVVNQVNDSTTPPANVCAFQGTDDVSVVPTMSPFAMLLMALVLAALAYVTLRRRA